MDTLQGSDDRVASRDDATDVEDAADPQFFRTLHWVRRVLPAAFLVLVGVLAVRELRGMDLHAVRALLHDISLSQLLIIQLAAIAGILAMSLYDWRAARALQLRFPARTLVRNAWIANAFNNLIGLSGLAVSLYPYLLPPDVTITDAAASPRTQVFMLTGIGMLLPIMLIYNGYQYFVFRGKLSQQDNSERHQ